MDAELNLGLMGDPFYVISQVTQLCAYPGAMEALIAKKRTIAPWSQGLLGLAYNPIQLELGVVAEREILSGRRDLAEMVTRVGKQTEVSHYFDSYEVNGRLREAVRRMGR